MSKRSSNYTSEFREEALKLASNSPSITGVAKALGIPEGTLRTWLHKARQSGNYPVKSVGADNINVNKLLEDNKALKKQVARLEQEKSILKKAATYFAKELE